MTPSETLSMKKWKFNRAFHFVIISEGGTNDDPVDRGGKTNWGISEKQYPDLDIANLDIDTAKHIYFNDYWEKNKCDKVGTNLGLILFDSSVNCGPSSAARWMQRACNKLGSDLQIDGIIGPKTLNDIFMYSQGDLQTLVISQRINRYYHFTGKYPEQLKYIRGWIKRVADLQDFSILSTPEMFKK